MLAAAWIDIIAFCKQLGRRKVSWSHARISAHFQHTGKTKQGDPSDMWQHVAQLLQIETSYTPVN